MCAAPAPVKCRQGVAAGVFSPCFPIITMLWRKATGGRTAPGAALRPLGGAARVAATGRPADVAFQRLGGPYPVPSGVVQH